MRLLIFVWSFLGIPVLIGQCPYTTNYIPQTIGIKYEISAKYDNLKKTASCTQKLTWTNPSNDTIHQMPFYMYLNAFRDMKSTYLKDSGGKVFGNDITQRSSEEWGHITISSIKNNGEEWIGSTRYIQPNDGNEQDATVLLLSLPTPIVPNGIIELNISFEAKLPKTIARAGYGRDDYALFVHWFPQLGVYEENDQGEWVWNCHQFFQQTEFYADFAEFKVDISLQEDLVIGGTGCKSSEVPNGDGSKTVSFEAKDVIDFAWSVYPHFEEYHEEWKGINITLLIPPEHCDMVERYTGAIKNALDYFEENLEKYPYPSITLIDPPLHTLNSGFMEYPMLITCASFYYVPQGIKTIESLAIHEFSHQYFMGIVATNEKEHAWMDEGFVTYFEDEIIDQYYGGRQSSIFNILGYRSGNREQSRLEYTSMNDLRSGTIARPGWEYSSNYKELIYAKTATVLQTLKGILGESNMKSILKTYYLENRFRHPKEKDLINAIISVVGEEINGLNINSFFKDCLHDTKVCDYAVSKIFVEDNRQFVKVKRLGDMILPQEIEVSYIDGTKYRIKWDGKAEEKIFQIRKSKPISSVAIDPDCKIMLDVNFNNNSLTVHHQRRPQVSYSLKAMGITELLTQLASFLF